MNLILKQLLIDRENLNFSNSTTKEIEITSSQQISDVEQIKPLQKKQKRIPVKDRILVMEKRLSESKIYEGLASITLPKRISLKSKVFNQSSS